MPKYRDIAPATVTSIGEIMNFSLSLDKEAEKLDLKYSWGVDKDSIIDGQGTNRISIVTDGLENETLTANVAIVGLPKNCVSKLSETGIVISRIIDCGLNDEFGDLANDDVRARIDAVFIELQNNPDLMGYIISYGQLKDVTKRETLIRDHIELRKYNGSRMFILYKGEEKKIRTRLLLVPPGADTSKID